MNSLFTLSRITDTSIDYTLLLYFAGCILIGPCLNKWNKSNSIFARIISLWRWFKQSEQHEVRHNTSKIKRVVSIIAILLWLFTKILARYDNKLKKTLWHLGWRLKKKPFLVKMSSDKDRFCQIKRPIKLNTPWQLAADSRTVKKFQGFFWSLVCIHLYQLLRLFSWIFCLGSSYWQPLVFVLYVI